MNENAERINGWATNARSHRCYGQLRNYRTTHPRYLVMDVLASVLIGFGFAWLVINLNTDIDNDDDDLGGGMMIPATNPI